MAGEEVSKDDGLGRAWIGVGVPILGLIFIVIMLAIAMLAGFAREQDHGFADTTQRLVAGSTESRRQAMANVARDYAHWNDAFQSISVAWDRAWIEGNMYTSNADGMLVFRPEGVVRYAWFSEEYQGEAGDVQNAAVIAARSIPDLRRLASAPPEAGAVVHTTARVDGKLVIIGVAAISPEESVPGSPPATDYLAVIDVVEAGRLLEVGRALGLEELGFIPGAVAASEDEVHHVVADATGRALGALRWRHAHPGQAAFSRQIWPVIFGLLCIGALAILLARLLVTHQMRVVSEARAALDSSQAKSEFLTRVSHELRTPLNAVIGYAEMIQEDAASAESRADAGRIVAAARHLGHLLNDILDQSRLDSGRVKLNCEVLPVAGVAAEVQGLLAASARSAGVHIVTTTSPLADFIYADHVRLRQCLLNIIGNAIKFSPKGATVTVRTRTEDRGGRKMVVFDVADTGIGIAKSEIGNIFRPFGQANAGIGRTFGGAGLGLSISRDLAREMGGDISVVSELGEGSTFSLAIPAPMSGALRAA